MLNQLMWWVTDLIALYLLVQALRENLLRQYFFFYFYLLHVFILSILRNYYHTSLGTEAYRNFYWGSQFVSVAWGYSVVWEVYRNILKERPGVLGIARMVLGLILPILLITVTLLRGEDLGSFWRNQATVVDLERYIRAFQLLLLIVILLIAKYFLIAIRRNLRGIILGYGIYISSGVINDTVRSLRGDSFQLLWGYVQQSSWAVALLIWCFYLMGNRED
jgi:hypothetical protein